MNSVVEVIVIVEGKTEQTFVEKLLVPYLAGKGIILRATQVSKPGQRGGAIRFERVRRDIGNHLKQRRDTFVSTIVDYYGTTEWPGLDNIPANSTPEQIAEILNEAAKHEIIIAFPDRNPERRFIPYMAIHEFEALLFSDSAILADELGFSRALADNALTECGRPEAINNSRETAPSHRLDKWSNGRYAKTTVGIGIAEKIGIEKMRGQCPLFDTWVKSLEQLKGT
jgi:hypothetical protein